MPFELPSWLLQWADSVGLPTDGKGRTWVRSFCGWAPGLRAFVHGKGLSCGCLAGTYETWAGRTVTVLDRRSESCENDDHRLNTVIAGR